MGTSYYAYKYREISHIIFKPKTYGIGEIFKVGTVHAIVFTGIYVAGSLLSTGVYHPI